MEFDVNGIPIEIVRAAMAEPFLRGRVILSSKRRVPLTYRGKIVGFVTPHRTKSGMRLGPIFVLPEYRGKSLLEKYYDSHPGETFVAFIPSGNDASRRAHVKAGFTFWKNAARGQWMKR